MRELRESLYRAGESQSIYFLSVSQTIEDWIRRFERWGKSLVYSLKSCAIKSHYAFAVRCTDMLRQHSWCLWKSLAAIISNSKQKFTSTTLVNSWIFDCVSEFQLCQESRIQLYRYFVVEKWQNLHFNEYFEHDVIRLLSINCYEH